MLNKKTVLAALSLSLITQAHFAEAAPRGLDCLLSGNLSKDSCISSGEVFKHLAALQAIADANGGNRAAGTTGHEFSGNYIAQHLIKAGYQVQFLPFHFMKFEKLSVKVSQTVPVINDFKDEKDFNVMTYSRSGSVSAQVTAVDLALGAGNASTSGCEPEDFKHFPAGHIALIQRGTCPFQQKVENAQAAKAAAVVLFNQGNSPDREAIFNGTLSETSLIKIPALAVGTQFAVDLLAKPEPVLNIDVETKIEKKLSFNVVAETKAGNPDNVVMIGAHLDSVTEGPGINDNASGSGAILEVALRMKNVKTNNRVRFAWFSAEELGLVGSTRYVESLSDVEKSKIAMYLNVDMVGSPNFKLSVFDGDGSKFGLKGPEGSASVEQLLSMFFSLNGYQSVETQIDGRSDYAAFAAAGIPIGGVFTGAEGKKTEEEVDAFGGKAGVAYDECYHSPCDTLANINQEALELNANAIAFLALSYGHSTKSIKDEVKRAQKSFKKPSGALVDWSAFPRHIDHQDVYQK